MKPISTCADLFLVFGLAFAALLVTSLPALSVTVARPIIGIIAVIFVPGYAFIAALFPQKATFGNGIRLALSFGLSLVIVPLLEIALNYSRWGVRLLPTIITLVFFTLVCVIIAIIRRLNLPPEDRFSVNWPVWSHLGDSTAARPATLDRMLSITLIIAIIASVAIASFVLVMLKPEEHYTEFYLLGANDTLGNYTTQYKVGVASPVTLVIVNNEGRNVTYNLVISENNSTQQGVVYSAEVPIANGQQWEKQIDLLLNQPGDNVKLDFSLYVDNVTSEPYRDVHLWVNVTA